MNKTLLVDRSDFSKTEFICQNLGALPDGCIRVEIGPFALTANNITYMAVGDIIGYWKFFDPITYGINRQDMGRMPVWGYGSVMASNCEGVDVGARIYGFFPITQAIDLKPVKCHPFGFQDGSDHRTELHSIYNSYTFTDADPSFLPKLDELQPILRPLFTTSFLIDDVFADESFFGAEQVILLSASSKTALGTAFCLKQRKKVQVVGLTSQGNQDFVKRTGFYDKVYTYDDITQLVPNVKTALIDMAGNGDVNANLYDHFGANIVYNCMVGKSHWEGAAPPKTNAGAPPVMFFAPDQAKKRIAEWGAAGLAKNLGARWLPFCENAKTWLHIKTHKGEDHLLTQYHKLLSGKVDPSQGQLFKL